MPWGVLQGITGFCGITAFSKTSRLPIAFAILGCMALAGCGGGGSASGGGGTSPPPPPGTFTAKSGVAQKGPLIKGSTVTAQELDANLSPTGKQYSYQTTSDLGTFSPTSTFGSQYIGLNASGYYFDEVQNAISTGTVTLNGYSDLSLNSVLNVNLLTTLAYQRIQSLMANSGMTFSAARTQAENEVLTALHIPNGTYGSFGSLDLGGGSDGDHILAAISSIFVYGNSAGSLSALIANFQSDIGANGTLTSTASKNALVAAAKGVNATAVAANLTHYYSSVGVTFTASDITDWIDQDGDGVVGQFKFQVPDATLTSSFTFPTFVVTSAANTSVSVTAGQLSVNGTMVTGPVTVQSGDVLTVSRGEGMHPNGVLNVYLVSGTTKIARVSFIGGLVSIAVTPSSPNVPNGLTQQFTATGTFTDTSTGNLTNSVSWTSGTLIIATVDVNTGLATSVAIGSTVVTATSGSVSGSTTLNVTAAALESISITPDPVTTGVEVNQQLMGTGTYSDGSTHNVTTAANWTSDTPSVATIGPATGLATGVSIGTATISATVGSITGTAPLSVTANGWFPTGSMISPHQFHTATLLPNGTVLVVGGYGYTNGIPVSQGSEIYDPVTSTWAGAGGLFPTPAEHTATLLPNGTVLVAGGRDDVTGFALANAQIYDPVANSWTATGSMTTARADHTATLLPNGTVLVAGGIGSEPASAEIYDPSAGTWTATGSMSAARYRHTATLLPNGTVLVAGGIDFGILSLASAEIYDPSAGTWTATGSMSTGRFVDTATLLPNGTVLVAGGELQAGVPPLASAEIYDPGTGNWTLTESMSTGRAVYTATLLSNGTVLAAGGDAILSSGPTASAEIYNSGTGIWTLTGSMSTGRAEHTATLLSNGTVLVAGGRGLMDVGLATAEIYDNLQ
jgi:hypothetical protein